MRVDGCGGNLVALLVSAWIEIDHLLSAPKEEYVALLVSAWIEIG